MDLCHGEIGRAIYFFAVWLGLIVQGTEQEHDVQAIAHVRVAAVAQPQDTLHLCGRAGLFHYFSYDCLLDGLIRLDKAPWHLPVATTAPRGTSHQQESPILD